MSNPTTTGECKRDGKIITMQSGDYLMENEAEAEALKDDINAALAAITEERDTWKRKLLHADAVALQQLATEQSERCEVCNSELSQCGVQGVDGEPSMDCLVCKLREQLAAFREGKARCEKQLDATMNQLAAEQQKTKSVGILADQFQKQLAAEREVGGNTAIALAQQITKLEDQLKEAMKIGLENLGRANVFEKQLAAEREKHESCVAWEDHNETLEELTAMRDKLAAEREHNKKLQDEIDRIGER